MFWSAPNSLVNTTSYSRQSKTPRSFIIYWKNNRTLVYFSILLLLLSWLKLLTNGEGFRRLAILRLGRRNRGAKGQFPPSPLPYLYRNRSTSLFLKMPWITKYTGWWNVVLSGLSLGIKIQQWNISLSSFLSDFGSFWSQSKRNVWK